MASNKEKIKILFVCTGNSCRSQIAEGWAEHLKGDVIEAFSAGMIPIGVNLRAVEVMAEAGVDISGHSSKHVTDLAGIDFDYIVTVCDNAREQCPIFPGKTKTFHKNFEDPSFLQGTHQEVMAAFRKLRDQMKAFIETLPAALEH